NGKLLFDDTVSPRSIHRARRISHRRAPESDPTCRSMPGRPRLRAFGTYRYQLRTGRFDETERNCQFPAHTIEPRFHGRTLLLDTGLVSYLGLTSASLLDREAAASMLRHGFVIWPYEMRPARLAGVQRECNGALRHAVGDTGIRRSPCLRGWRPAALSSSWRRTARHAVWQTDAAAGHRR